MIIWCHPAHHIHTQNSIIRLTSLKAKATWTFAFIGRCQCIRWETQWEPHLAKWHRDASGHVCQMQKLSFHNFLKYHAPGSSHLLIHRFAFCHCVPDSIKLAAHTVDYFLLQLIVYAVTWGWNFGPCLSSCGWVSHVAGDNVLVFSLSWYKLMNPTIGRGFPHQNSLDGSLLCFYFGRRMPERTTGWQ